MSAHVRPLAVEPVIGNFYFDPADFDVDLLFAEVEMAWWDRLFGWLLRRGDTKAEAVDGWNTRAAPTTQQQEPEQ